MAIFMTRPDQRFFRPFDQAIIALPILGGVLLLALVGWPHQAATHEIILILSRVLAGLYGFLVLARWAFQSDRWHFFLARSIRLTTALAILLSACFEGVLNQWLVHHEKTFGVHGWFVFIALGQQLLATGVYLQDILPWIERHVVRRLSPSLLLVVTFIGLILGGTALLKMPNCTTGSIGWLDALFTSTSAVCVTGLIVTDTATTFTFLGQAVILALIQIGGFGIVILTFFLALLAGQGLSITSRVMLRDLLSTDNLRALGSSLFAIIGLTALFEITGAVALYYLWHDSLADAGLATWWFALFHSISAFCNAGFSLFSAGLMDPLSVQRHDVQGVLVVLIIAGGIGFPVFLELLRRFRHSRRSALENRHKLSLHTRIVFVSTGLLLLLGTIGLGLASRAGFSPELWWDAFFNAVTARTAGFNVTDMSALPSAGVALMLLLMFIGGSPGGIAGGIKTTTFTVALLNLRRILLNRSEVQIGTRRLDESICHRAFATVLLSQLWILAAAGVLLFLQPQFALIDVLFETVSAFATVGLSRDLTAHLEPISKLVIILTMFVGRVGVLNFFFSFLALNYHEPRVRFPSERVIVD